MIIFTPNTVLSSADMNLNLSDLQNAITGVSGSGVNYLWVNGVLQIWGSCSATSPAGAGTTVTFPYSFDATPIATAIVADTNGWIAYNTGIGTTSATFKQTYTGASLTVYYHIIGRRNAKP